MEEQALSETAQTALFAGVGVAVFFTFVWMIVVAITVVRYSRTTGGGEKAERFAIVLWLVSLAGVFTGPCVAIFSLIGLTGGAYVLLARADANAPTRAAAVATVAHSAVMITMITLMMLVYAIGGVI